jgi:hypothetical protein
MHPGMRRNEMFMGFDGSDMSMICMPLSTSFKNTKLFSKKIFPGVEIVIGAVLCAAALTSARVL